MMHNISLFEKEFTYILENVYLKQGPFRNIRIHSLCLCHFVDEDDDE